MAATFQNFVEFHRLKGLYATDLLVLPEWDTVGRPTGGDLYAGLLGFNSDDATIEWWDGTQWVQISSAGGVSWTLVTGKPNSGDYIFNQNSSTQTADYKISGSGHAAAYKIFNGGSISWAGGDNSYTGDGIFYLNTDILDIRSQNRIDMHAGSSTGFKLSSSSFELLKPFKMTVHTDYSTGGWDKVAVLNTSTNFLEFVPRDSLSGGGGGGTETLQGVINNSSILDAPVSIHNPNDIISLDTGDSTFTGAASQLYLNDNGNAYLYGQIDATHYAQFLIQSVGSPIAYLQSSDGSNNNEVSLTPTVFLWNTDTVATRAYARDSLGGGGSVSFGSDNQIPFTNSGGTDFDYSANLIL
jgi:hypothetical protein